MKRDIWVDRIKILACMIVVFVHFFESMIKADLMDSSAFWIWFFKLGHVSAVQLFMICSGFLYQKYCRVCDISSWRRNVLKKLIMLGIPYVFFSTATWIMKSVSSQYVNHKEGGLLESLFVHPIGQYWYLYILFFLFLITPTINSRRTVYVISSGAVLMQIVYFLIPDSFRIFLPNYVLKFEFWFVTGMVLGFTGWKGHDRRNIAVIPAVYFVLLSIVTVGYRGRFLTWGMEILVCSTLMILIGGSERVLLPEKTASYTMPVYLMHTIFAALIRIVLIKMEIFFLPIHIIWGLTASVFGPVIAMNVLSRMHLDFVVSPRPVMNFLFKKK